MVLPLLISAEEVRTTIAIPVCNDNRVENLESFQIDLLPDNSSSESVMYLRTSTEVTVNIVDTTSKSMN